MTLKIGDTAYHTKKALTHGIDTIVVQKIDESGYLTVRGTWYGGREGRDIFATLDAAQQKAKEMAARALKALAEKRAHLESVARSTWRG